MRIGGAAVEQEVSLHDGLVFVGKQDAASDDSAKAAFTIEGLSGYIFGVDTD